ncbi:PqqD family peptide modification chaperone [Bradyrhizobium sp. CCGE-LA001]|uniref:PqqD family peptide modification chaperone n=1 Tax=Bradyrhizobium sp. CCGE-LA001 TaxID=1223566 RepID=UPI000745DBCF|nr:PqqD family peptide modification chaperone [Bradyrhizobium sp. CCGE-LA001]AMA61178.1 serine/threonine protein kinase [Bradyrhizobium sp. CCGE-LA001]
MLEKSSAEVVLKPAIDAVFALFDGQPVLFSATGQKIFQLDQVGGFIWCRLAQGASLAAVCHELGTLDIDEPVARQFVRQAISAWIDRGLLDVDRQISTNCAFSAVLGRHRISVRAESRGLLQRMVSPFCASDNNVGRQADIAVEAMMLDDHVLFSGTDAGLQRCGGEALAPTIKAHLTDRLIRSDRSVFALHAASLAKNGAGLLLCGEPGAGKSTLTLQLVDAEFQYSGDDIVLIEGDGTACGIPFALTLKEGSWERLSALRSNWDGLTHRRADGVQVRYLQVSNAYSGSLSVSWIIFLNRVASGSPKLTALDQLDSMKRLIEGAFAADGRLSTNGFFALKEIVSGARSFLLTYCEAVEARELLVDLCDGKA